MNAIDWIQKGYEAQEKYCEEHHLPFFVSQTSRCFRCGRNVFDANGGYSPEEAGKKLITGCPHCNASFCD